MSARDKRKGIAMIDMNNVLAGYTTTKEDSGYESLGKSCLAKLGPCAMVDRVHNGESLVVIKPLGKGNVTKKIRREVFLTWVKATQDQNILEKVTTQTEDQIANVAEWYVHREGYVNISWYEEAQDSCHEQNATILTDRSMQSPKRERIIILA